MACTVTSVRVCNPSLVKMLFKCTLTVLGLTDSWVAISLLVIPALTNFTISSSRSVRGSLSSAMRGSDFISAFVTEMKIRLIFGLGFGGNLAKFKAIARNYKSHIA